MLSRAAALGALTLLLVAASAHAGDRAASATPSLGSVRGTLLRGDPALPEPGRTITLVRDGGQPRTAVSDARGRFAFDDLAGGFVYELRADADGCAPLRAPVPMLLAGEDRSAGNLVLGEPGKFTVRVIDDAGAPVAGASVEVTRETGGPWDSVVCGARLPVSASLTTGPDGRATVTASRDAAVTVAARAAGRARVAVAAKRAWRWDDPELEIELPPAETWKARLVDAHGRPVAGARLAARAQVESRGHCLNCSPYEVAPALLVDTVSGPDGRFAFDALAPGTIELFAAAPGAVFGVRAGRFAVPLTGDVDVTLPATATESGRVTERPSGAPVPGALVLVSASFGTGTAHAAVTDADGAYVLAALPASTERMYQHDIQPPRGFTADRWRLDGRRAEATLIRAATLTGRVLTPDGPVPGAQVFVMTLDPSDDRVSSRIDAVADAEGRFVADGIEPGRAGILAFRPGPLPDGAWDRWRERVVVDPGLRKDEDSLPFAPGETVTRDIAISAESPELAAAKSRESELREKMADVEKRLREEKGPQVPVRVRVTTADGVPLRAPRAYVGTLDLDRRGWDDDFLRGIPSSGTFETEEPVGSEIRVYALDAAHERAASDKITVPAGPAGVTVDLVLQPMPVTTLRIVSEGAPVAGATLLVERVVLGVSGADGTLTLRRRKGDLRVAVLAPGCMRMDFEKIEFPSATPIDLELPAAQALAGVVVDGEGRPLAGVRVTPVDKKGDAVVPYGDWDATPVMPPAVTDAEGRFRLGEMAPPPWRLRIDPPAEGAGGGRSFVTAPLEGPSVRIVAGSGTGIAGRVLRADGTPVAGAHVDITPRDEEASAAKDQDYEMATGNDGAFGFEGLRTGTFVLEVVPETARDGAPVRRVLETGSNGVVLTLAAAAEISGVALDPAGAPAKRADLVAVRTSEPGDDEVRWPWETTANASGDGTFRIVVPPGAEFKLVAGKWARDLVAKGGEHVASGAAGVRVVLHPETPVGGVVVGEDGQPARNAFVDVRAADGARRSTRTNYSGKFEVLGLVAADKPLTVVVQGEGGTVARRKEVAPGTKDLRLVVTPGKTIRGRLLTAGGKPASDWQLRARRAGEPEVDLWRAHLDREGRFELKGLDDGEWQLDAIVAGLIGIDRQTPLGTAKAGDDAVEFRLPE